DRGNDNGLAEGGLQCPQSRSFLSSLVENDIDKRLAGSGIYFAQDLRRDLDEITVQVALVPLVEDVGHLVRLQARDVFQDRVRFTDELHVAVLDAVVDHLHVMAGAIGTHVPAARFAIYLRRDLAEDRRDDFPRIARATRHKRRTFERAFFAARNAAAYKMQ